MILFPDKFWSESFIFGIFVSIVSIPVTLLMVSKTLELAGRREGKSFRFQLTTFVFLKELFFHLPIFLLTLSSVLKVSSFSLVLLSLITLSIKD